MMEQHHRYCSNCGQQLLQEDRFCAGCGRPVHKTARVPTPEADVPVPPPPQPDEGGVPSPQPQRPSRSGFWEPQPPQTPQPGLWDQIKRPVFWFVGSLIVASVVSAAADPASFGRPGLGGVEVAGFFLGTAIAEVIMRVVIFVPLLLVFGSVFFVVASVRGSDLHFLRALFNPQMMVIVVIFIMASAFTG